MHVRVSSSGKYSKSVSEKGCAQISIFHLYPHAKRFTVKDGRSVILTHGLQHPTNITYYSPDSQQYQPLFYIDHLPSSAGTRQSFWNPLSQRTLEIGYLGGNTIRVNELAFAEDSMPSDVFITTIPDQFAMPLSSGAKLYRASTGHCLLFVRRGSMLFSPDGSWFFAVEPAHMLTDTREDKLEFKDGDIFFRSTILRSEDVAVLNPRLAARTEQSDRSVLGMRISGGIEFPAIPRPKVIQFRPQVKISWELVAAVRHNHPGLFKKVDRKSRKRCDSLAKHQQELRVVRKFLYPFSGE